MTITQQRGKQILDGSVQRSDLDTTTAGEAVIRKIIAGNTLLAAFTGVDAGTGDVTLNTLQGALGKTYTYSSGKLATVLLYSDAAKTTLLRTITLGWTGDNITTIELRNAASVLLETRTLSYDGSNNITGEAIT